MKAVLSSPASTSRRARYRYPDDGQSVRSAAAGSAVLMRSQRALRNPGCTGLPTDASDRGEASLDVDHLYDLAAGG